MLLASHPDDSQHLDEEQITPVYNYNVTVANFASTFYGHGYSGSFSIVFRSPGAASAALCQDQIIGSLLSFLNITIIMY